MSESTTKTKLSEQRVVSDFWRLAGTVHPHINDEPRPTSTLDTIVSIISCLKNLSTFIEQTPSTFALSIDDRKEMKQLVETDFLTLLESYTIDGGRILMKDLESIARLRIKDETDSKMNTWDECPPCAKTLDDLQIRRDKDKQRLRGMYLALNHLHSTRRRVSQISEDSFLVARVKQITIIVSSFLDDHSEKKMNCGHTSDGWEARCADRVWEEVKRQKEQCEAIEKARSKLKAKV